VRQICVLEEESMQFKRQNKARLPGKLEKSTASNTAYHTVTNVFGNHTGKLHIWALPNPEYLKEMPFPKDQPNRVESFR
jgi:hypothetical protein